MHAGNSVEVVGADWVLPQTPLRNAPHEVKRATLIRWPCWIVVCQLFGLALCPFLGGQWPVATVTGSLGWVS